MKKLLILILLLGTVVSFNSCSLFSGLDKVSFAGAVDNAIAHSLLMTGNELVSNADTNTEVTENCDKGGTVKITVNSSAHTITEVFTDCALKDVDIVACTGKTDITLNGTATITSVGITNVKGKLKLSVNGQEKECEFDFDESSYLDGTACGEDLEYSDFADKKTEDYCSDFGL